MKRILGWNDWYIHPFTLLYLFLAYYSNNLWQYVMALGIVCFHEMFHYIFAKRYHFDIDGVEVLPFGAFLSLHDYGLHHIVEELITILVGPCSHLLLYFIIMQCGANPYLLKVNALVFIFNVLPIYPLDGSKILLLILSTFMDYQKAVKLQIKVSILTLSIVIALYNQIGYYIIYGYLIYLNYQYIREYRAMIIRLFLHRRRHMEYTKYKLNTAFTFYRPYINIYELDTAVYSEAEVLEELIKRLKND